MKRNFQEWPRKNGAILHFHTPFCYWQLIMKKHGLILYSSPNPNPVVVRKCNNSAKNIMWCGISRGIGFCFWLWNFQKGSNTTLCNFQGWKFVLSPISRGKVKKWKIPGSIQKSMPSTTLVCFFLEKQPNRQHSQLILVSKYLNSYWGTKAVFHATDFCPLRIFC